MSAKSRAAVGATRQSPKQSEARRKQVRDRIALGVAGALLLVGVLVFIQSRTDEGPGPTSAAEQPGLQEAPAATPLKKGGTLEPAARDTAEQFILTAVGRTRLDEAWELVTPEFRSGVTRAQWRRGELPVPPFPARDLATTGFDVLESSANKVLLQVLLVPKPGTEYVPTRYDLTLERASAQAPWKVSYANPYAPPGRYANPE